MSTLQARTMSDRVVLIHERADQTIFSELDVDQAAILLEQLQDAVSGVLAALSERAMEGFTASADAICFS